MGFQSHCYSCAFRYHQDSIIYYFFSIIQEKCFQYWPSDGSVTYGEITIEIKSDLLADAISVRDFLITHKQVLLLTFCVFFVCFCFCFASNKFLKSQVCLKLI